MTDDDVSKRALWRRTAWATAAGLLVCMAGLVVGARAEVPDWAHEQMHVAPVCGELTPPPCIASPAPVLPGLTSDTLKFWSQERALVRDECLTSSLRLCQLELDLADPKAAHFLDARQRLEEERVALTALAVRERRLKLRGFPIRSYAFMGLVDAAVAILAISLLLSTGRVLVQKHGETLVASWARVNGVFVAIGAVAMVATMVLGGVLVKDKTWVGTDSFAVSRFAWSAVLVSMIGVVVMFSQPMTLLWLFSRRSLVPGEVRPLDSGGECGIGDYVTFIHTWTILGFALALLPAVFWIRFADAGQTSFQPAYLIPPIVGAILTGVLTYRLIRNAIDLRQKYRHAISALASSWREVEALKPAPDPTAAFIGDNWWKLPATLGSLLFALWGVLEWTGAARVIVDVLQ